MNTNKIDSTISIWDEVRSEDRTIQRTLLEMVDDFYKIQKLLQIQKDKAQAIFEHGKAKSDCTTAQLLCLEMLATGSADLVQNEQWLKNDLNKLYQKFTNF